jgi:threonine aldolase
VFFSAEVETTQALAEFLGRRQILISPGKTTRLVTHLDISREDVSTILVAFSEFFAASQS